MADYLEQVGLTKRFLDTYHEEEHRTFPGGGKVNYLNILTGTHEYLNVHVHPTVQARAALHTTGLYLTDHGPRHIETVMRRASRLVRSASPVSPTSTSVAYNTRLTSYELFLLPLAIHFHDVGNIYGREGHEQRILDVMKSVPPILPLSWPERLLIAQIAATHGGTIDGDKDTIRSLPAGMQLNGDAQYRPQLLAAILRLADEIADETPRADDFGLLEPTTLPATCLLYHKYASAMRVGVELESSRIALTLSVLVADLMSTFQKMQSPTSVVDQYFLDEIYERTLKTYHEMVYCDRYMADLGVRLADVAVTVDVYDSQNTPLPRESISYVLGGTAYPRQAKGLVKSLKAVLRGSKMPPNGQATATRLAAQRGRPES